LKKRYLALLLIFVTATAFGQSNFYRLSAGLGGGANYSFTDVGKGQYSYSFAGYLDYHFTPFITAGLEVQNGKLKGADLPDVGHLKAFSNSYTAMYANVKFRAGEITDFYYSDFLNYTKGFYIGTGLGVIANNVDAVRVQPGTGYVFPGVSKSTDFVMPLNVGIDFYFPDGWGDIRYIFNINYQAAYDFGDNFDGYNSPPPFKNVSKDIYFFLSAGFKYTFGPKGLSSKTIR
jgi:hypothetical protein